MLSGDLTPLVDWFLEMKSTAIQIKDMHFCSMINKAQGTSILPNSQYGHIILIATSISDIIASSFKRPIKEGTLLVDDKINSDSIGQHIVPYGKAGSSSSSKLKLPRSNCKGVAKWIDMKSDPFVCLALKPTPQKNQLKKSKHTFDFTFCDHVFDVLLKNNFIRIIDHNAYVALDLRLYKKGSSLER